MRILANPDPQPSLHCKTKYRRKKKVLPEVPPDLALDGRYVAHEQLEEGGLAHPVGPHDGHSGVHVNTKLNILEQRWLGRVVEARKK